MLSRFASVVEVVPQHELTALLKHIGDDYSESRRRIGARIFGSRVVEGSDIVFYSESSDGHTWEYFRASELIGSTDELHIAETLVNEDGSCLHFLFASSGVEQYRLVRVALLADGSRVLTISVSRFRAAVLQTTNTGWFYLVEETTNGWRLVRIAVDIEGSFRIEALPATTSSCGGRLSFDYDPASCLVQASAQDREGSSVWLIPDTWGERVACFEVLGVSPDVLLLATFLDNEPATILVGASSAKYGESSVTVHRRNDRVKWDAESSFSIGGVVLSMTSAGDQIAFLIANGDDRRVMMASKAAFSSNTSDDFLDCDLSMSVEANNAATFVHSDGDLGDSFVVATKSAEYLVGSDRINEPYTPAAVNAPVRASNRIRTRRIDIGVRDGLACTVELATLGEFADVRFAHILSYSSYGISQRMESAPEELSVILSLGPVAFCVVSFEEVANTRPSLHQGPATVLLKQDLLREATEVIVASLNMHEKSVSIEGRSAGATLCAPLLATLPRLIAAAILGRPLVDPIGVFQKDRANGSVVHLVEWGDPENPEELQHMQLYSPLANLPTQSEACVLITVDPTDQRIGFSGVKRYAEALAATGATVNLAEVGGGHRASGSRRLRIRETLAEYIWLSNVMGWNRKVR